MISTMTVANTTDPGAQHPQPWLARSWGPWCSAVAAAAINARLRFNGRAYPGNPTVPPARPLTRQMPGQVLIAGGDRGRPLFRTE